MRTTVHVLAEVCVLLSSVLVHLLTYFHGTSKQGLISGCADQRYCILGHTVQPKTGPHKFRSQILEHIFRFWTFQYHRPTLMEFTEYGNVFKDNHRTASLNSRKFQRRRDKAPRVYRTAPSIAKPTLKARNKCIKTTH